MSVGENDDFLTAFAETRGFLLGAPVRPRMVADGRFVLFLRSGARDTRHDLFEFDTSTGQTRRVIGAQELLGAGAEQISAAEKARRERKRITDSGLVDFAASTDGRWVLLPLAGQLWLLERASGQVRSLLDGASDAGLPFDDVEGGQLSDAGTRIGFVCRNNLWLLDLAPPGGVPHALTRDGGDHIAHGQAEFVAQEEMGRHTGFWLAPDGHAIAYTSVDESDVEVFTIADPARPEATPSRFRYPRAGRANARVALSIVHVAPGQSPGPAMSLNWDQARYPYLARFQWTHEGTSPSRAFLVVQTRDQRESAILAVDAATGATRCLLQDQDPDWVNLDPHLPRFLSGDAGFLHVTENDGARALQLRDRDGQLVRTLVGGDQGFLALVGVAVPPETAVVLLGDATSSRIVRVSLQQGMADHQSLVDDGADHTVISAGGGRWLVDQRTRPDGLPGVHILDAAGQGRTLGVLPDAAESPPFLPNLEYRRVGPSGHHAVIIRPRASLFQSGKKYPVIVHVYGGPHALMVRGDARHYLLDQWMADQGAIVVAIDNRGTPRRGRDWERAIKGSFARVPLDEQVQVLGHLLAEFPEMDGNRVGIYGWSFGGYMSALAVMKRPDVFKVGVAGAPVVDWHDYDTHYTERYLDLPAANPDGYRDSSLLTHADQLSRPLLIVHGTADDNVYFFHALKLADALLHAGRRFDFLPLPGATHQMADAKVRRQVWFATAGYLLRHL